MLGTEQVSTGEDVRLLNEKIKAESSFLDLLNREVAQVIVGQRYMMDRLMVALLADGHVLLEGVPGLAKTLAIRTLSDATDAHFSRIQFTPDLLPADVVGTNIYNQKTAEFSVKKGPIFANFILADEINRAPAKVQSALLEAMQERQVTLGEKTFQLPNPFLVMATQNPIEQEGTYPLPEAQVDRFLLKVVLDYPNKDEERQIIRHNVQKGGMPKASKVINTQDLKNAQQLVRSVYMDEKIESYIVDLVFATRSPKDHGLSDLEGLIQVGASPRASIGLAIAAKAYAFLNRRGFVIPDDVRAIAVDVLQHRIGTSYEADAENVSQKDIVERIVNRVQVP